MAEPLESLNGYAEGREDADQGETTEWLEAFDDVVRAHGAERAQFLLERLLERGYGHGVHLPFTASTPYVNTIPRGEHPPYPGDRAIERRIKSILRWNAMAMVVRANKHHEGIGGHISTYASAATLYEVAFNHYFRGRGEDGFAGDLVYFQGHASPGIYARAYLEGRISEKELDSFRRELSGGPSSYPHPWLMPTFWEFPTVSMGLGPISAIYQARFNKYLHNRGLLDTSGRKVWAFLGDGETDEPESLGAITLASRERLDNLIFVVNCNLQRLDGPVRGNGKIIQELETVFRGAGWRVIKVVWGGDWDPLLEADETGLLVKRMTETVDGQYQKYTVEPGSYIRQDFFGKYPELLRLVEGHTDEEIEKLRRGGHDPVKVNAAYKAALETKDCPVVILAKTVKGYGLGEAGEGRNVTHQQKKLNEAELRLFRDRFEIPVSDADIAKMPFYRPAEESPEIQYLMERRRALGGFVPARKTRVAVVPPPGDDYFAEFTVAVDREVSTTMVFVQILRKLLRHPELGQRVVPIVPDEARTFGMESLFKQYGIYASQGQLYEPVDAKMLLSYREARNGQILEEGITEAGSMASFTAAGTAYATHGMHMIPFFIFYSMFGFQRVGDLIWAAADQRTRGFLLGATSGRTTLNGEGLQHEDGHSHVLANTVPNCLAYDPAYHYELAVILRDGLRRMYGEKAEAIFYYITLYNENYLQPERPEGVDEGILAGLYRLRQSPLVDGAGGEEKTGDGKSGDGKSGDGKAGDGKKGEGKKGAAKVPRVQLFGSGSLLREALRAQELLAELGVAADVWSATSYKQLRYDALACERWNLLHPGEERKVPYVTRVLEGAPGPVVAVSDYMRLVPDQIARWVPQGLFPLGTDGFGRSDTRPALRRFFEVDGECVALAALSELARRGDVAAKAPKDAIGKLGIDPEKAFALFA